MVTNLTSGTLNQVLLFDKKFQPPKNFYYTKCASLTITLNINYVIWYNGKGIT